MYNDKDSTQRFNEDKIDFCLIPWEAIEEEAKVWTAAQRKYPPGSDGTPNWLLGGENSTVTTALSSAFRHLHAIHRGELIDPESGFYHAAHLRCNCAMIIKYAIRDKLKKNECHYNIPWEKVTGTIQGIDKHYADAISSVEIEGGNNGSDLFIEIEGGQT